LKVPGDVTIVFPDDNFGYIRQFPNSEERKRKGGFGVYYHISYLGRPFAYLWLNSTPPALIWQEMNKAYENGMRQLWIVNVGDIKPAEIGMEFFLQMAYDAGRWTIDNQHRYLQEFTEREFGPRHAADIADILDQYYRLGFQRKPEHLQWYLPSETPRKSDLTDDEMLRRLQEYGHLRRRAEAFYQLVPESKRDAYFQLVLYPVSSAAAANKRFFNAELAEIYKERNDPEAVGFARRSIAAGMQIERETLYFNETLAGAKWRHIMAPEMGRRQWPSMRTTPPSLSEKKFEADPGKPEPIPKAHLWLAVEKPPKTGADFVEWEQTISIEAEHFTRSTAVRGSRWQAIVGLGKTGDSVSVFPQQAETFTARPGRSPTLEYSFYVSNSGEFTGHFYLVPTQPLFAGAGLRLAVAIDDEEPRIVTVGKNVEVSSPEWAKNILDQTTIAQTNFNLKKGRHILRLFAVDTGVVLDKIVLSSKPLPRSYFGPPETRGRKR
jgi:hypothetical protein